MEGARGERNTNRQPENGSAASLSRHNCASESMPLRRSTASTATSTRICGVIWIIFLLPAKPAASYPNPVPILSSPRASCRERTPTPLHTPSTPLTVEPTAPETPAAPVEESHCTPAFLELLAPPSTGSMEYVVRSEEHTS